MNKTIANILCSFIPKKSKRDHLRREWTHSRDKEEMSNQAQHEQNILLQIQELQETVRELAKFVHSSEEDSKDMRESWKKNIVHLQELATNIQHLLSGKLSPATAENMNQLHACILDWQKREKESLRELQESIAKLHLPVESSLKSPSASGNKQELQSIKNEIVRLRRYIFMKDICPELPGRLMPKLELPHEEVGLTYEFALKKMQQPFLNDYINDAYFLLVETFRHYGSSTFTPEAQLKRAEYFFKNNAPHMGLYNVMVPLTLCTNPAMAHHYFDKTIKNPIFTQYVLPEYFLPFLICFYLDEKDDETALYLLDLYKKKQGKETAHWLPVADLAFRNGEKQYARQSALFRELYKNTQEYSLEKLFANKRVALIGNGPQEVGKGLGAQIDAYDFVIRMNTYNLTPAYSKDYGSKCDMRHREPGETAEEERTHNRGNPKFSFMGCNPWAHAYSDELIARYEKNANDGNILRPTTLGEMRYTWHVCPHPSGGLILLSLIHSVNPDFTQRDCYGFSFKDEGKVVWAHTDGKILTDERHNLAYEREVIRKLLKP